MVFIVIGLGNGDEGKGSTVDYLVRRHNAKLVVRFNGGPQAAHNVIAPDGTYHRFAQFGSGTLVPGVLTFLSSYVLVDPLALEKEYLVLKEKGVADAFRRLIIDRDCLVVTPFHKLINQMRETARGSDRFGSCGLGVGETAAVAEKIGAYALRFGELADRNRLHQKLFFLKSYFEDKAEQLAGENPENKALASFLKRFREPDFVGLVADAFSEIRKKYDLIEGDINNLKSMLRSGETVFEGAQGVLLDKSLGFLPYVTKTITTAANALSLLKEADYEGEARIWGVLRAYQTRHGPGPFVTEDRGLTGLLPDRHNGKNPWQGPVRIGWFDFVAAEYALRIAGPVDYLAVTNLDRLSGLDEVRVGAAYEYQGDFLEPLDRFFHYELDRASRAIIRRIIADRSRDSASQAKLTKLLISCRPLYVSLNNCSRSVNGKSFFVKAKQYLEILAGGLNKNIAIASVGPKATDKISFNSV
jgi:adenylosuccinate synthase